MQAIEIKHCQTGSVKLSFVTPELRPSEAGACIALHGKNVTVSIVPEDTAPEALVKVDTDRGGKTPSQRLRNVLYILFTQTKPGCTFDEFYIRQYDVVIDTYKAQLND